VDKVLKEESVLKAILVLKVLRADKVLKVLLVHKEM
jgi:hypothetical protein